MEIITTKSLSQMAIIEKSSQTLSYIPRSDIFLMDFHVGQEQLKNSFSGQMEFSNTTYKISMNIGIPQLQLH